MYCSCTSIHQIQLEIWLELDLVGLMKNGQIPDFPEPESGTTVIIIVFAIVYTSHTWQHT